MFRLDAIRSAARQTAWKYHDEDGRNYNPFARTARGQSYRNGSDPEALTQARSLDSTPAGLGQNAKDFGQPGRASTEPPASTQQRSQLGGTPLNAYDEKDTSPTTDSANTRDTDNSRNTAETLVGEESHSRNQSTNGMDAKKRRKFVDKLHFGRKDDETLDTPEEEKKKPRKHIGVWPQLKATVFGSWINLLLVAVPAGFAVGILDKIIDQNAPNANAIGVATFVVNFVAIIPLAAMLSYATEELAMYVGETLGGLLNATFGNATELIVSIIALQQKKILIVQTSLIGSMLSNLLLVLGMCFFFGGLNRVKQHFNITVAQTASSLLALSIGSLIIPTAFHRFGSDTDNAKTQAGVAPISRGTSVILLLVYASYLLFQLKTHTDMYNEPSKKGEKRKGGKLESGAIQRGIATMGAGGAASSGGQVNQANLVNDSEDEEETPSLTIIGALLTLTISTVLVAFCSEFMVTGIDAISGSVSEEFIGLILLPIVGNAAEHATAVTVAIKDKMDLAIGVAVGSSMQIALLVLPLMVIIGWCGLGETATSTMTLDFDGFQVTVLFIAVLLVNYLIQVSLQFLDSDPLKHCTNSFPGRRISLARRYTSHGDVCHYCRLGILLPNKRRSRWLKCILHNAALLFGVLHFWR